MTWIDPIVEEVRRVREAYAAKFNYDLDAIFRDLKEQEEKSGRTFVSPPPREEVASEAVAGRSVPPAAPALTPNIVGPQAGPTVQQ